MKIALIMRKLHLYLALFLTPWILMYGISGFFMNHRELMDKLYKGKLHENGPKTELVYSGTFPEDAKPNIIAEQILSDLDLVGFYNVNVQNNGTLYNIFRADPIAPKRILFTPSDGKLVIEPASTRLPALLNRIHHYRGYWKDSFADDSWALTVDLMILSIFLWPATGLVMWWSMKRTKKLGSAVTGLGIVMFLFFVFAI